MIVQHKSLKDELLYLIGRATAPMSSAELYEKCELADEIAKVAKAVANLQGDGKIVRAPGEGRARYTLAAGVPAPAPAGKEGRSRAVQKDDAAAAQAAPLTGIRPAVEPGLPVLDIPNLGDHLAGLGGAAGKTVRRPATAAAADDEIGKGLDLVEQHAVPEVSGDLYARAKNSTQVEARLKDERLADAIIARLKRQLAPTLCELEAAAGMDRLTVHIHIEQVDFHLGGL